MAARGREFITPVGRIVWGHPMRAQQKRDQETKQLILNELGKPVDQWAFGVAFDLGEFEREIWQHLRDEAATGYPNGVPSNFSFKYIDSRSVDKQGKPYSAREGYAGCAILTLSTELAAPQVATLLGSNGTFRQLTDKEVKCGDYVRVGVNCAVNVPKMRTHTPSLYVNPMGVELVGYGVEIRNGPDLAAMFGGRPAVLPPGASLTPIASAGVTAPGMMGAANPMMAPGAPHAGHSAGHPGMATPTATGAFPSNGQQMAPPAHDFVQNAAGHAPQPQHQGMPQHQGNAPGTAPGMFPTPR